MTGAGVAAVVRAGAVAAQLGTALLRCPESGASDRCTRPRSADPAFTGTAITRAFSGRRARGLVNDFMRAHPDAPSAYPHINNATRALRQAAVARRDPHAINLWAGQGFALARSGRRPRSSRPSGADSRDVRRLTLSEGATSTLPAGSHGPPGIGTACEPGSTGPSEA